MKTTTLALLLMVGACGLIRAADTARSRGADVNAGDIRKANDAIFADMMQSLSPDIKARLDSTRLHTVPRVKAPLTDAYRPSADRAHAVGTSLDALPDGVREKVESTIEELKKNREARAIEFKERLKSK